MAGLLPVQNISIALAGISGIDGSGGWTSGCVGVSGVSDIYLPFYMCAFYLNSMRTPLYIGLEDDWVRQWRNGNATESANAYPIPLADTNKSPGKGVECRRNG